MAAGLWPPGPHERVRQESDREAGPSSRASMSRPVPSALPASTMTESAVIAPDEEGLLSRAGLDAAGLVVLGLLPAQDQGPGRAHAAERRQRRAGDEPCRCPRGWYSVPLHVTCRPPLALRRSEGCSTGRPFPRPGQQCLLCTKLCGILPGRARTRRPTRRDERRWSGHGTELLISRMSETFRMSAPRSGGLAPSPNVPKNCNAAYTVAAYLA